MFSRLFDRSRRKQQRGTQTPRPKRLAAESLEPRRLLTAVTMSDYEQLLLELVNRARANPQAEVTLNDEVFDLNEGVTGTTITNTPKQPLASIQVLVDAGKLHVQDMLANNYFSHYTGGAPDPAPPAEPTNTPTDRAATLGYSGPVGENIAWNGSTGPIDNTVEAAVAHANLFASPTHRVNMLTEAYDHVGMAIEFGTYNDGGTVFNVAMVAEEFGFDSGNPYLTGVAFTDAIAADNFYTVGESLGGLTISALNVATGDTFTTTTGPSGGYQVKVPAGTYTVTAHGDGLSTTVVEANVVVSTDNVKVDFNSAQATALGEDFIGLTGTQFWVAESNGSTFGTRYYGSLPSGYTYTGLGTGDFNGDGLDDYATRRSDGELFVSLSTGDSSFRSARWGKFSTVTTWNTIVIGDFNGDGLDDIMGRADNLGSFWLAESTGDYFTHSMWGALSTNVAWLNLEVGDFNGDGNADIASRASDGTWWVARSNGVDRFFTTYWGKWSTAVTWSDVQVGDFDGDGRDDLMGRVDNRQFWINRSLPTNFFSIEYWGSWSNVNWNDITVGDFNGDSRDDIAGRVGGQWWIAESTGQNFLSQFWGTWSTSLTYASVMRIDVNNDGNDDLLGQASDGRWWISTSSGSHFTNNIGTQWSTAVSWYGLDEGNVV